MNEALLHRIIRSPRLPSMPAVAAMVIDQCRSSELNIPQIAQTISNDPALAARILKTVNSSFYGLPQRIGSVSQAMVILGLNNVKTLALSFSLVGNLRQVEDESFNLEVIWKRSLFSAVAARAIARRIGVTEHEEVLLGGLLQDLGVIAMVQVLGAEYVYIPLSVGDDLAALWQAERKEIDLDHAAVGAALAEEFRLPATLVKAIRHHELPNAANGSDKTLARTVSLGATVADGFLTAESRAAVDLFVTRAQEWFGLTESDCLDLLERVSEDTRELAGLFEIEAEPRCNPVELVAEAQEMLAEASLRAQHDITELRQQNEVLEERATTDALTGVANRGRFDEFIRQRFDHATRQSQPIAMLLLDIDRFKSVNDTHGHQAGDQVLVSLGRTLSDLGPEGALVARYGGEEFAIVLPGHDRKPAAALAEKVRRAIEQTPVTLDDGESLRVTASIGVAAYDGARFFRSVQQLVSAADQGVYAAKAAGRNQVKVFVPREPARQPTGTP